MVSTRSRAIVVSAALSARVSAFNSAFQAGQFRQAESFVDEESKELYYNVQKSRILGHEI
jgi:hypothetical protein